MVVFSPSGKDFTFANPNMSIVLNKYFMKNLTIEANFVVQILRADQEANMRRMTCQINNLEGQIEEQMLINKALREAKIGRPSISGAQSQAMATHFRTNDDTRLSGV
nr:agamous-like MADS-box protein AGL61 [Ipomoea batatas]